VVSDRQQVSQFLIYRSANGAIKIDVRFEGETVWLTQQLMAELFQTTQQNISLHIHNVYKEGELDQEATHKEFLSVRRASPSPPPMRMQDWIAKLDGFLQLNERGILTHAGTISHELALQHTDQEYACFNQQRLAVQALIPDDFERSLNALPAAKPRARKKRTAE
jgi:hypothetical protein